MIAQPLVIEHELSDFVRELFTLPLALPAASLDTFILWSRRACSPDRVGRGPQFVGGHMGHRRSLSGGVGRFSCRALQFSGRAHGVSGRGSSFSHRDFTSCPGVNHLNCLTRTVILRSCCFKEMQDMLGASSRP